MKDPIHKSLRTGAGLMGAALLMVEAYPESAPYAEFKPVARIVLSSLIPVLCGTSKFKQKP